jgi:hypothetical protein
MNAYAEARQDAQDRAEELRSEIVEAYSTSTQWHGLDEEMQNRGWEVADTASIWTQDNWNLVAATRSQDFDRYSDAADTAGSCFDSLDSQMTAIAFFIRESLLMETLNDMFDPKIVQGD